MSNKTLFGLGVSFGIVLAIWLATPSTCLACTDTVPQPSCGANISATTVHQGTDRKEWWGFLAPRDPQVIHVYLGLNHNAGSGKATYQYSIATTGDWQPDAARGGLSPATGNGVLGEVGTQSANDTIEITIPYTTTDKGNLNITTTLTGPDCSFNPPTLTTTVRLNEQGPTIWPVMPHTCPKAGEKPKLTFGISNPSGETQTYSLVAVASNLYGGTNADVFSLNGQGGEAVLDPLTVRPYETKKVNLDCETFGYCFTGAENRIQLKVKPAPDSTDDFEAVAWSNVTIRDPNAVCPESRDWWHLMPAWLAGAFAGLIGIVATPILCVVPGYMRHVMLGRNITSASAMQNDGLASDVWCFFCCHPARTALLALAVAGILSAVTYITY
jgi:hypothetical protein